VTPTLSDAQTLSLDQRISTGPGCWVWTGYRNPTSGYGTIKFTGTKGFYAHRLVYELLVGPIPEGLQLDHLCRNRWCVNPSHMEPVTQRENLLRGDTVVAKNAAKTHCLRGHLFDYVRPDGTGRDCRTCKSWRSMAAAADSTQAEEEMLGESTAAEPIVHDIMSPEEDSK
jgi:HNH endonuclease